MVAAVSVADGFKVEFKITPVVENGFAEPTFVGEWISKTESNAAGLVVIKGVKK
jgi:hypothetical protein